MRDSSSKSPSVPLPPNYSPSGSGCVSRISDPQFSDVNWVEDDDLGDPASYTVTPPPPAP